MNGADLLSTLPRELDKYLYHSEPGIVLYCADCREILPLLPKVDLVLTDPPYGLGKKMSGGTWGKTEKYSDMSKWDKVIDQSFARSLCFVAPKAIIWGANNYEFPPSRCWLIWDKQNAVHTVADCEMAWTSFDRPTKRLSLPVGVHDSGHPTQKPAKLMQWCISFAQDAMIILDPLCGSGTTLVAAKHLGRQAIGIEIEEKYCAITKKRLGQGVLAL
jgi:site-specific DNA-methyltransferase (adenine-specific)